MPLLILIWTYIVFAIMWYTIAVSAKHKQEHKVRLMSAYKMPAVSFLELIKFKIISILERIQEIEIKKLIFAHIIIWANLIIFLIKLFN